MKKVIVEQFGHPEVLKIKEFTTPEPAPGEVRVRLTSIGMNHADLMARKGEYRISTGLPPFTPGIEGGGVIDAVGKGVTSRHTGQRVILGADIPQRKAIIKESSSHDGTYSTHYIVSAEKTVPAPDSIPDHQLGAIWLPYLTAWGCLVWKQRIKPGQFVAIPAASSSVALAAAQIARHEKGIPIGMTTSQRKAEDLKKFADNVYDAIIVTHDHHRKMSSWHRDLKKLTDRHGVDVFFDPVAAGEYLQMEVHSLAQSGTIWIYGLLGQTGPVDVTPLIRKHGSIRGWWLNELTETGGSALKDGYHYILKGFEKGYFRQRVAKTFSLNQVVQAHMELQKGEHIGKLVLIPN